MKGFVVTTFTVLFAVSTITSISVIGISVSGISNIFTGASHSTDAQWVENNLGNVIVNKCQQNNKQEPSPQQANYSHTFNNLDNLSMRRNPNTKKEYLELNYKGSSTSALLTNAGFFGFNRFVCGGLKLNGTEPDGDPISRSDTIEVNDGNNLKFRVFETGFAGGWFGSNYRNITIQVRQD